MYRYTYVGYPNERNVTVRKTDDVYFSVIGYHADNVFVYVETPVENLDVLSLVEGDLRPFPNGEKMFRMERIFHCDDWSDDSILCLPIEEREPVMSVMMLQHDAAVLAYVGHHYVLQEEGGCVWSRYYSIYHFANILVSVTDRKEIPAPARKTPFEVPMKSVVEESRRVYSANFMPLEDGTLGWKKLS